MNTVNSDALPLVKELREAAESAVGGNDTAELVALLRRAADAIEVADELWTEMSLDADGNLSSASRTWADKFSVLVAVDSLERRQA